MLEFKIKLCAMLDCTTLVCKDGAADESSRVERRHQ